MCVCARVEEVTSMAEAGYEQQRKKLTGERENIQKKTFTKWINSFLKGVSVPVDCGSYCSMLCT